MLYILKLVGSDDNDNDSGEEDDDEDDDDLENVGTFTLILSHTLGLESIVIIIVIFLM